MRETYRRLLIVGCQLFPEANPVDSMSKWTQQLVECFTVAKRTVFQTKSWSFMPMNDGWRDYFVDYLNCKSFLKTRHPTSSGIHTLKERQMRQLFQCWMLKQGSRHPFFQNHFWGARFPIITELLHYRLKCMLDGRIVTTSTFNPQLVEEFRKKLSSHL